MYRLLWRRISDGAVHGCARLALAMALAVALTWLPALTSSYATTVMAQSAPNCAELLLNGSFEETANDWQAVAGSSLFAYNDDDTIDGRRSLYLGFTTPLNIPATYGVEQRLTLPAASTSIEIGFAYAVLTEGGADEGDRALLTIHNVENDQLLAMLVFSPTDGAWNLGRYDLTPLAGKEIRLAFLTQNDGEPGQLAMRIDAVTITACLPPELFALTALPTPQLTAVPPTPELLMLTPVAPSASSPGTSTTPPAGLPAAQLPPGNELFPPAAHIESLEQCSCAGSLYACSSFSSWAVAQACYTHCQITAGYDIHNLDPDRNGVACELELQDVAPLDATPSPQPTPSAPISETISSNPAASQLMTGTTAVTGEAALAAEAAITNSSAVTSEVASPEATPMPVAAGVGTTNTTASTGTASTDIEPLAAVPPTVPAATPTIPSSSTHSQIEMLAMLLFSPVGFLMIGALVVLGGLSLWVAYMLGRRGQTSSPAPTGQASSDRTVPDHFALHQSNEISAPET